MKKLFAGLILGLLLVGCSNMTSREKSALVGAGAGALVGSALGDSKGALIGAGVGALGGAAVDNYNKTGNVLGN
ncbi:YMGG-like glycine zipper-containing protein [Cetobacterium somerae]|uniref:YMGG-like glycine zipper-containing protein n=1 Tax=Cetobacterium sp. NK01 TaxID=2993530 RepID=UPI002116947F|nr:YMGG-like glycine zipper-containing protein [Cetobacterium sp. NK01]MCQ8212879.1 YMGG-like glycine zipper-containing protein [Cetobacterium sp. NK01]